MRGRRVGPPPLVATTRRAVLWVPDWPVVHRVRGGRAEPQRPGHMLHGRGMVAVSASATASKKGSTQAPRLEARALN